MPQEHTDTGIDAVYARLETAERELARTRAHHVVTLNTLNKTYSNLTTALDTLSRFKVEYEAVQDDLNAARTASELAAHHREALEDALRKCLCHMQQAPEEIVEMNHVTGEGSTLLFGDGWYQKMLELDHTAQSLFLREVTV